MRQRRPYKRWSLMAAMIHEQLLFANDALVTLIIPELRRGLARRGQEGVARLQGPRHRDAGFATTYVHC